MIRRPPRSTQSRSSAASDVYKRQTTRRIIAFSLIAAAFTVAPACAQQPYDGLWNVTILTRTGNCEPSVHYPLTVTNGRVSGAADVSGSIGRQGIVKVSILSLIHISEPTRLGMISYAVFC